MNSGCLIVFIIATFYFAQSNGNHQQDIDRGIKQYNGIWRKIQSFLSSKPYQDPDRKFINPYDRNLTRPLTSKPVVGTLLSPIVGILQDELITGIVWWKIVFGFLFVLVTGAANWIFL